VVKKEGAVVEKVWDIVGKVSCEENFPSLAVVLELCFIDIEAEPSSTEEIEDEKSGVKEQTAACSVPDDNVTHQMDLVVGVSRYVVRDASGQERPLRGVAGEIVILNILLIGDQHLELELEELVPKREDGLLLRYQLVSHHLPFDGAFILVIFGVPMLFNVPDSVRLVDVPIRDNFVLDKAPVWILLSTELQGSRGVDMDQPNLGVDCMPHIPSSVPIDNVHLPKVLSGHGDVVVYVAGHLLAVR